MQFSFGNYLLDVDKRELRLDSDALAVAPQVFDLLVYLVENSDRVVTKDDLIASVWNGRIVSDSTLTGHINAARVAIGDNGKEQRFIKTFPRKGFRFVGTVIGEETSEIQSSRPKDAITEHPSSDEGVVPSSFRNLSADEVGLGDRPAVAVLPFSNMSGDPEQEYFSDGVTEDIITELSKISGLFVIARHSSFIYKNKSVTAKQVGEELGVSYLLEGSVRRSGNRLRITAQLVEAASQHHMWAERYDRNLEDVFAIQEEVARNVAGALKVALTQLEKEKGLRSYTNNQQAYDYFLRGRACLEVSTVETTAKAGELFEKAIELDPNFAGAYALLSHVHWRGWRNNWSDDPQSLTRALEAAETAVSLDDLLPLAHIHLAWVKAFRREHDEAIGEARRAIALDPNFAEGYARLGHILDLAGEPLEGIELVRKAMGLDPHYPSNYLVYLGHAYYLLGMHGEAITSLNRAITRSPDNTHGNLMLAIIHSELGHEDEAQACVSEILRVSPRTTSRGDSWPYKDETVSDRYCAALRAAGLPE